MTIKDVEWNTIKKTDPFCAKIEEGRRNTIQTPLT